MADSFAGRNDNCCGRFYHLKLTHQKTDIRNLAENSRSRWVVIQQESSIYRAVYKAFVPSKSLVFRGRFTFFDLQVKINFLSKHSMNICANPMAKTSNTCFSQKQGIPVSNENQSCMCSCSALRSLTAMLQLCEKPLDEFLLEHCRVIYIILGLIWAHLRLVTLKPWSVLIVTVTNISGKEIITLMKK